MDCQNAQQHGLQGAGWTGLRASHGTPRAGGYERDLEGHPSETRSASDPGTRQREPPGRKNVPRDGRLRNSGVSVRQPQWNHHLPR